MDIFQGQFDFDNFTTQIHDFDPGFGRPVNAHGDRVFWTVAIPEDDVEVHFGAGRAEMEVNNLGLRDYTSIPQALGPVETTPFDRATVSFHVVWNGPVARRLNVQDGTNGNHFAGAFEENRVTVSWSARNDATGFRFTSNPGNFATSVDAFAELGHERNGIFFGEEDDDSGRAAAQGPSLNAGAGRDQAFAALPLEDENWAIHPVSVALSPGGTDRALRDYQNNPGNGEGRPLPPSNLMNSFPGHSGEKVATVLRAARDRALQFVSDPGATSLGTDIGLPGEDILLR